MSRKFVWATLAAAALAALVTVGFEVAAQRPPGPGGPGGGPGHPGRFVVARVEGNNIILLDTATGDLYRATSADIKRFSEKPRVDVPPGPPPAKKDMEKKDDKKDMEKKDDKKDKDD